MAARRRVIEIAISEEDRGRLETISCSRTEPACRVERARMLLAYCADPSTYAVGAALGVTHQTVQRCLMRAVRLGVMTALDDSPRPGKAAEITPDARAWLVSLACQKPKDLGYPHELWTTQLLASHARTHSLAAGHPCLDSLVQGTVCKILARHDLKPHKVRYYLERRDADFETKMAEVLCVYREVAVLRKGDASATNVAVISYDEKPGIQAIGNTTPDLPPEPGTHSTFARDHEYKRHGTLSLLAGIDLLTGKVHASVEDRHRSREFVGFLEKIDAAYPADTAIKLILDNHSAHISRETKAWLATRPQGRFSFVFTPKHGSWLNLVEGFFSKMARSMLRHIRVASKAELKARLLAYLDEVNRDPVIHTWTYKIGEAA
jgi:transposase